MKKLILILVTLFTIMNSNAQTPSKVDFNAYLDLAKEVEIYRKDRMVNLVTFLDYAKDKKTIVLDTRSKQMYDQKHIKGAVNINFSDFTQQYLDALIPDPNTRILIYCNNNIDNDMRSFMTKAVIPRARLLKKDNEKPLTLALNIPTFINLYGYGFKNVYELSELVSVFGNRLNFEGTLAGY
jgi:Rhodanese-like domain